MTAGAAKPASQSASAQLIEKPSPAQGLTHCQRPCLPLAGQVQCAEELLSAGMSASGRCDGCPPLNMAACLAMHPGRAETALQLIQLLLQHEASPTDV